MPIPRTSGTTWFCHSTKEYKIEAKFNVKATEKLIDKLSKFLRILDTKIQEINWTIDIDFEEL
jgi:acetone carboxylase gamma subunit